jgi:hypothetical protein
VPGWTVGTWRNLVPWVVGSASIYSAPVHNMCGSRSAANAQWSMRLLLSPGRVTVGVSRFRLSTIAHVRSLQGGVRDSDRAPCFRTVVRPRPSDKTGSIYLVAHEGTRENLRHEAARATCTAHVRISSVLVLSWRDQRIKHDWTFPSWIPR